MSDERERIEKMAADGKISREEAERLKAALDKAEEKELPSPEVPPERSKSEYSKLAIASLVALVLFWPAALILGIVAWVHVARSKGRLEGKWMAITSTALSAVLAGIFVIAFGSFFLFLFAGEAKSEFAITTEAAARSDRVTKRGEQTAASLARDGKLMIEEYLKFKKANPNQRWTPKKLKLEEIDPDGTLGVEDAVVLYGSVLIASSTDRPTALKGAPEPGSDPQVQILRGTYEKGGKTISCLQFKAVFKVPGGQMEGSARIIVRLQERIIVRLER